MEGKVVISPPPPRPPCLRKMSVVESNEGRSKVRRQSGRDSEKLKLVSGCSSKGISHRKNCNSLLYF